MGGDLVSTDDLDQLVAKELRKRQDLVKEVASQLRPDLDAIRKSIVDANHIKRTLGRDLRKLQLEVRQSNSELRAHTQLRHHPAGADDIQQLQQEATKGLELLEEFGVENLSLEQKQALPEVLIEAVDNRRERKILDRRSDRNMALWLVISTLIGSLASAIVAVVAVAALQGSHAHIPGT